MDYRQDGGRVNRRYVDYRSCLITHLENRLYFRDFRDRRAFQPNSLYTRNLEPPVAMLDKPVSAFTTRLCRTVANKGTRSPIYCAVWLPESRMEGRYLVTVMADQPAARIACCACA